MSMVDSALSSFKWLTLYELVLVVVNLVFLVWLALPKRKAYRWVDFVPSAGLLIAMASVVSGDTSILGLLIYSITVILFFCTLKRVFKPSGRQASRKFVILRAFLCACGIVPLVVALPYAGEIRYNPVSHFGDLSYSQAFVKLNERLAKEYPFGEWKNVDWNQLKTKYEPLFETAEKRGDKDLYYRTLREYLFSFRDGHIKIVNDNVYTDNPVFKQEAGGGLGISTIQLDNGKVLVNLVLKGSLADQAGIKLGAEIVTWNGIAAKDAYNHTSWSENPMATVDDQIINQGRFMVRAPIGQAIELAYRNGEDQHLQRVTLKAYDDQFETLKKTRVKWTKTDAPIEAKILDNGYGYVKIRFFLPTKTVPHPEKLLDEKLNEFLDQKVKGMIIDVRDNPGGNDELAASIAGHFVSKDRLYEYVSYYSQMTGKFEINGSEKRTIKPAKSHYQGNIAILINNRTVSSGEGLPIVLKGLPQVKVIGFTTTNGSFGVETSPIQVEMPEGYLLQLPDGRSLNQDHRIQGDSDNTGHGGGVPDIRIPLNEQTFQEKYVLGQDVELKYAIDALAAMDSLPLRKS